ncbi:MAG: hypothetical protein COZ46_02720 [Verrucomicrobia bacterium CG_4_10_14_3_um_filter_43_23]|nr:MAG: hypothetical protein AUJ82_06055 [Verrucomicrobia bacterium CG1_02_43_26]PIP60061.1 MAG: hypothetical protein COX01_00430 [Verrucomicrobia bacterium CG22_combo_CG10-13_8_21_14_all_43_17]PIX58692.1 MAG: hypothetical protein COZ46_02720 [Verrucomicrobia bacterium CG_4_10_14_3_um_filter_43_23]PIY62641.1 MAG: hypothetical protein COY94_01505 [Verrucomicrobia bacterium CG_4_10_14_0_8_um_filter_43_34]PJA43286.1 MAG: hypothetical protein CO175_08675 [Verrucomicrobia bacterium CG_4_9_14_3_um_fi
MKHYFVAAISLLFALNIGLAADVALSAQTQEAQLNPTEVLNKPDVVEKRLDKMDDLMPQFFEGKLIMKTNFFTNNKSYILENSKGEEIGIIEVGPRALTGNIADFLDKSVRIYGTAEPNRFGPFYTIHATSIQLQ